MSQQLNRNKAVHLGVVLLVSWVALASTGCGKQPPRTRDQNFRDRMQLPTLYLTTKSGARVIAPADRGIFADEKSGEMCWPALMCTHPNCPGRTADGEPVLFIAPDTSYYVTSEGKIASRPPDSSTNLGEHTGQCPACLQQRDLKSESEATRQEYLKTVQPYVLPEAAEQLKKLEEELPTLNR